MHEASLAQGLLNVVVDSLRQYNAANPERPAGRVTRLTLGLGLLSCVEKETFRGCFELLSEGTPAQGAQLDLEIQPLPCRCESCSATFLLEKRRFVCPRCGGIRLALPPNEGHGLTLLGLEVEKKDNEHV